MKALLAATVVPR